MKKLILGLIALGIFCMMFFGAINMSQAAMTVGNKAYVKPKPAIINTRSHRSKRPVRRSNGRTIIIIKED